MNAKKIVTFVVAIVVIVTILIPITNIKSDNSTLNVIIIDGQSNAAYWDVCDASVVTTEYDKIPTHDLYYYGTSTAPIQFDGGNYDHTFESYGIYPIWDDGWRIGGYEPILANELSDRSNRDTLVINIAIGGAGISKLEPTGDGGKYGFNAIDDALKKIEGYDSIEMIGWIWIQGETDKNTGVDSYEYGFANLKSKFNSIGAKSCYAVTVPDRYGGNSNIALTQIAEQDTTVHLFSDITNKFSVENGCLVDGDTIHWTQKGRNIISQILGDSINVQSYGNIPQIVITLIALIPVFAILGIIAGFVINRYFYRM